MENRKIIQVEEKVPAKLLIPLSIQHMFAMFGASVLVPFVFGINPAIVLFMNGVGTLLFILVTKGKAPAYLGSSFAFLAPQGLLFLNSVMNMRWVDLLQSASADVFWRQSSINSVRIGLTLCCHRRRWDGSGIDWFGVIGNSSKQCGADWRSY